MTQGPIIETEFLIVGAGPAGASLACFLGQNGLKGIVISSSNGTADTPRAHITSPFTVECFRDLGLEQEVASLATRGPKIQAMRWCQSMAGVEYGKALYWEGDPNVARNTALASPCDWMDFLQSDMEPLLLKYATHHGFQVRFSTDLVTAEREEATGDPVGGSSTPKILCRLRDTLSQQTYSVRTSFLFGADGAKSTVARTFDFAFDTRPSTGVACNILIDADLSHLMNPQRYAGLHWLMKPDLRTRFGIAPVLRMIRPWDRWLFIAVTPGATTETNPLRDLQPDSPELLSYLRDAIGDPSVAIKVLRVDPWTVRDQVAVSYSAEDGDVFLLGDAAHRHPPSYGLGSNTCVQDAYNLAWKVALVSGGLAGRDLLKSYSAERQPVGVRVVRESNAGMGAHAAVWDALGMFAPTPEEGIAQIAELSEPGERGAARRKRLGDAIDGQAREGAALGLAGNQTYDAPGCAVWLDDETEPRPEVQGDDVVEMRVGTYPGGRLPHARLSDPLQRKEVSTQDLAGHGEFVLLVGLGGEPWRRAVEAVAARTGIPIKAVGIGFGLEWHDVYRQWEARRGVGDDGCVLVRPDRFVAWRSVAMIPDCEAKLMTVLDRILFRAELAVGAKGDGHDSEMGSVEAANIVSSCANGIVLS